MYVCKLLTSGVITLTESQSTLFYSICASTSTSLPATLTNACQRHRYALPDPDLDLEPQPEISNWQGEKCRLPLCSAKRRDPPGLSGAEFFHPLGRTLRRSSWEKEQPFRSRGLATALPHSLPPSESTCRRCLPRVYVTEEAAQGLVI